MVFSDSNPQIPAGARQFPSTHWSVVLAAAGSESPVGARALEHLCRVYWYPLYAFVRRQGWSPHDSQDLTQAFFAHLLEKGAIAKADTNKGRFRSFLLASLTNFLNNERDKAQRLKRGGGVEIIPLDYGFGEDRFGAEPASPDLPENIFARQWAQAVVAQVVNSLRAEFTSAGQAERFAVLQAFMMGDSPDISYTAAARQLGLSVSAVTSAIHRMRSRFRVLFHNEIAQTVADPEKIGDEIRCLLQALGG